MLEVELHKKEKLVDEILMGGGGLYKVERPGSTASLALVGGNFSKMKKLESHLTLNLKRKIKEMHVLIAART
jgi:hypothetical protein